MKINPVGRQGLQVAKSVLPESKVKIVGKVDGYVEQMLRESSLDFDVLAEAYKVKDVKIAQKDNLLLVNSGVKTTFFNLNKMKHGSELDDNIVNNIRENGELLSILG